MNSPITFCISTFNSLNYLKLAIHSVRKYSYYKDSRFIIFAENCTDNTNEWLKDNQDKYNFEYYTETNSENKIKGIGGGMNECAEKIKTKYIMFLHADFFVAKNWDLESLKIFEKYPNEKLWVSSQRIQPNLFNENSRPGTLITNEFGNKYDNFEKDYFIEYAEEFSKLNPNTEYEKGEGVSGLIKKEDWDYIGGNDPQFSPAYWEDKDLFIRMMLANYKFVLTTNSVVFHFGSRSGNSNFPTDEIIRSEISKQHEQNSGKKFFKKWGFWPVNNQHQFDVIPNYVNKSTLQNLIKLKKDTQ